MTTSANFGRLTVRKVPTREGIIWWADTWNLIGRHILFTLGMSVVFMLPEFIDQYVIPGAIMGGPISGCIGVILIVGVLKILAAWDRGDPANFWQVFVGFWSPSLLKKLKSTIALAVLLGVAGAGLIVLEQIYSNPTFLQDKVFRFSFMPVSLILYAVLLIVYALGFMIDQFLVPLVFLGDLTLSQACGATIAVCKVNWRAMLINLVSGVALLGAIVLIAYVSGQQLLSVVGVVMFVPMMLALPYVMFKKCFTGHGLP